MYVVIGAGGFLGSQIIKSILENTDKKVLASARSENFFGFGNERVVPCIGDVSDKNYLDRLIREINNIENADIVYTVACHNIDFVAELPEIAAKMNIEIPQYFTGKLKNFNKLFFTSSDTVYGDRSSHLFSENDELCPISIYGRQKAEGERIFNSVGGSALRLPLMFSRSVAPAKKHFCDIVCENLINGKEIQLSTGFLRSALDYKTVADIILRLCDLPEIPEKLNIAGDESLSKYDLGLMIAEKLSADKELIIPTKSWGEFKTGAERADCTLLDNSLLKKILDIDSIRIKL